MMLEVDDDGLLYSLALECEDLLGQVQTVLPNSHSHATVSDVCVDFQQRFAI